MNTKVAVNSPSVASDALITPQQRTQFEEQGYFILRGVLTDDAVAGARAALSRLVDAKARELLAAGLIDDTLQNEPFETRLLKLYAHDLEQAPESFRPELHLPELFDLFFNPTVLDMAEAFLGPEVRLYPNYTARPKLPDHAASLVLWHQDGGYTEFNANANGGKVDEMRMLNVWSPLVPARRENGCMQFVPGTHKLGVVEHIKKKYYLELAPEILNRYEPQAIDIEADPGDVVLFHNLLFHRGLPNRTDTIRWSLDWRYQDATQDTLRVQQGHLARSRQQPETVIQSASQWAEASFV
jgi:ectoine hydroxylase-related dioxygenase (phytanoyl-CoA dioxygenase family)